jgi:hypothetical protein
MKLKPVQFNKNECPKVEIGLIAQEVYELGLFDILDAIPNPELKKTNEKDPEDGYQWGLQYDKLGVIIIPVIKRLMKRIKRLEHIRDDQDARIELLEDEMVLIRTKFESL